LARRRHLPPVTDVAVVVQVFSLPAASLHYQHAPHPHLDGLIVILNNKGGSDDSKASSSAPLLPLSSSARGQAKDGRRCRGTVVHAAEIGTSDKA